MSPAVPGEEVYVHKVFDNVVEAIGDTPCVRLNTVTQGLAVNIYAKLEFMNPGGSVKDRIAVTIIDDAEASGELQKGSTIVEATSGNTGAGLAMVGAIRGYKTIFVLPDKQSEEKRAALRAYGAKVVVTPTNVEADDPRSYYCVSRQIADETPNSFYANQYHNPSNPESHYEMTGPEIYEQLERTKRSSGYTRHVLQGRECKIAHYHENMDRKIRNASAG